ncbi:MAG: putative toxin-antitoxin system toxin component, PIN family, partial [Tepidisphaeraceae bacterium]
PVLRELARVLDYEEVKRKNPALMDAERVAAFLRRLSFRGEVIRHVPRVFAFPRDPLDEPYVNLAIAAQADFLVTRDNDLLSLMSSHAEVAKQFRRRFRTLRVVSPSQLLSEMVG